MTTLTESLRIATDADEPWVAREIQNWSVEHPFGGCSIKRSAVLENQGPVPGSVPVTIDQSGGYRTEMAAKERPRIT